MRVLPPALLAALCLVLAPATAFAASGNTAALQVALRAEGLYAGNVDGVAGPGTDRALRAWQRRMGLPDDGVLGPRTRTALGRRGRPAWASRTLSAGAQGWDVAALQFELAEHGFPGGPIDGGPGQWTANAIRRFQAHVGLTADGVAGPAVVRALARPPLRSPVALARPISVPRTGRYGPRGVQWHAGQDYAAQTGTPVTAAAAGTVTTAASQAGGWGNYVIVDHGSGVRTLVAHLSSISVSRGQRVATRTQLGRVGSTGFSTGPHLHFEVIVRGANIDPASALP